MHRVDESMTVGFDCHPERSEGSGPNVRRSLATLRMTIMDSSILSHLLRAILLLVCLSFGVACADEPAKPAPASSSTPASQLLPMGIPEGLAGGPKAWTSPEGISSSLQTMLLLAVLSLAPAALLMTTCYVRIVVVLSLLRQAVGTQNLPPTQVITTLALFLTLLIMSPVWKQVYDEAVVPYTQHKIGAEQAWTTGVAPVRRFMSMQIERTKNTEDVWLFMSYLPNRVTPASYDDVPLQALLPAFMLSELKTAFLIGFQIYLPFLILDMVVASVMVSMGMLMVPPVLVSLPFKLLLFVLVDGWRLVVGMLMQSFQPFT
jgi:flagellar biosynthesis protein FliP